MKLHSIRLAVFLGLAAALPSSGGLPVYEPFNYSVGSLTGQNGGTGFASGWVASTGANQAGSVWDQATSVLFDGSTLNWTGALNNGFPTSPAVGSRYLGATPSVSSDLAVSRTLSASAGTLAGADGVLWMSAVSHFENRGFGAGITIGLGNGYIANRGRAFQAATTDFIGVNGSTSATSANSRLNAMVTDGAWTAGQFAFAAGPVALPTTTTVDLIVVMKFTFGASDTVEAAFFTEDTPLADITEANFNASPNKVTATYAIDENGLTVLSTAQGRFNNAMDEIRIGDTFDDVISLPPPGPVDAGASTVSASPNAVPADGTSASTITVALTDAIGVPIQGKEVTLANTAGPQAAVITPSTAQTTGANGQVTFTVKSTTPGVEEFTATDTTDALVITQTAGVTFVGSANADLSTVAASPVYVTADGSSTSTITVTLIGLGGFPVANKQVSLANTAGPQAAVITPSTAQTSDANGKVTFTVKSSTPGAEVFTATDTTDSVVVTQTASVSFVGPVSAGVSTVAAAPSRVLANGALNSTITVSLKDANGFPVQGREVTLANTAGPQAAVIDPLTAQTSDANGKVTFTVKSSTPGTEVFTATDTTDSRVITQTASVEFVDPAVPLAIHVNIYNSAGTPTPEDPASLEGPGGGLGETWSQFNGASGNNLISANGTATAVGFTVPTSNRWNWGDPALKMLHAGAAQFGKGDDTTFTITGLTPGSLYNLWIASYAHNDTVNERALGAWSTTNPTSTAGPQMIDCRAGLNGTTWEYGRNCVLFENVEVDGGGQIVLKGDAADAGDYGDPLAYRLPLNGFQLLPAAKGRIASFGIPGSSGVIDQNAKTIALQVPFGTNLATLAPQFTLTSGTCDQTSGAPPSPTFAAANPVHYVVTDTTTDPVTVNDYAVTVTVSAQTGSLVIDLGAGTVIEGGKFGTWGATNLPLPALPPGSILRSIAVNAALQATNNDNYASDLSLLLDPTPATPGGDFSVEITNGAVPFGAALKLKWPAAADNGPVTPLVDTRTEADWAAAGTIDLATTGLFLGNAYGGPTVGGTWSGTITLIYDLVGAGSKYDAWSGGAPFGTDKNGDGVANGMAFLLGAANPDENALGRLPTGDENGGGLVLTFSCLNAASRGPAVLNVQWSNDLGQTDPWPGNVAAVPETTSTVNGVSFVVTPNGNLNDVVATIPSGEAAAGKLFGRLSGSEN